MTNEELLKPRYKVIADYPFSQNCIGDILERIPRATENIFSLKNWKPGMPSIDEVYLIQYPHLFKKLEWWEERKPEDLPKYVKTTNWGVSFYQWDKHDFPYDFLIYNGIVPATEEEYLKNQL